MMRLLICWGICLPLFTSIGCSKNDTGATDSIWVETALFSCCNVWGEYHSEDEIPDKVKAFFRQEGMIAQEVEVIETGFTVICVTCCKCPADHSIRVKTPVIFKDKAASFGFEEL